MGTRSTIALEYADGTVDMVYCHWDGYIEHNGRILFEHYKDPFKVQQLMDMGDLSSLGPVIGEQRPFCPAYSEKDPVKRAELDAAYDAANNAGWCTFYGRDRGEQNISARRFPNFEMYRLSHQYEEYDYILRTDGNWYVSTGDKRYSKMDLAEVEAV